MIKFNFLRSKFLIIFLILNSFAWASHPHHHLHHAKVNPKSHHKKSIKSKSLKKASSHHSINKGKKNVSVAQDDLKPNYHKKLARKNYMIGIASFYGNNDGFDGKLMADGRSFDAHNVYLAAHPTLPLGTKLLVTNLDNDRRLCVEVADRMPRRGRVIDLSDAAASYLGMHKRGLAHVKLVRISDEQFQKQKRFLDIDEDDDGAQG